MRLFSVAALLTAIASAANGLIVNTPANVVQCQPLLITWDPQGSSGPFFLSVHPGNDPSGAALVSWDNLTGTSLTWTVTIAAGQSIGLLLRDNTGATSQSAPFTVSAGSTTDCSSSSSVSSPAGSSLSTSPGSSTSLTSVSSSGSLTRTTTTTTTTSPTTTTTSTRPPSSSSTPSSVRSSVTSSPSSTAAGGASGALSNAVNFGSAGFLAALVGAVLA